jgi:spermidine synthase
MNNLKSFRNSLLFIYFGSGFAALLYQIVWQRWLVFYTGMSTMSVSLIVSAFMAGLGLGYLAGGWVADRNSQKQNLRYFMMAEGGIALFAVFSKYFLYDILYQQIGFQSISLFQTYGLLFLVLLLPTSLMGFSLPVLSKAVRWSNVLEQARYVGGLYFVNTLGAAVGAWTTGIWLIKYIGFAQTVWVGAGINLGCALGGYLLLRKNEGIREEKKESGAFVSLKITPQLVGWAAQFAWSGFAAISLELIWFRILELMVKSVSITFAILLGIYLGGLAFGTFVGAKWKGTQAQLKTRFWWSQMGIYVYTIASLLLLWYSLQHVTFLEPLRAYLERYEPTWSFQSRLLIYGILPTFLLLIPTFLMGLSFSLSQLILQDSTDEVGRRVGFLQFSNIVGSTLGAWWVAFIGFEAFGTVNTLKILMILGVIYLLLLFKMLAKKVSLTEVLACVVIFILPFFLPVNESFWRILNGLKKEASFFFDEDATGLSVIKAYPNNGRLEGWVFANGIGQSLLPFEADPAHVALGLLPTLLHPNPQHIAVIGLGSGGTLLGVSSRSETQQIDCFELMANQGKVLTQYAKVAHLDLVPRLLTNPILNLTWRDGRYALHTQQKKYDIIEADALRPLSAYAGNLYSKEYFELLKSKLKEGGYAVSWHATERTRSTMLSVFPYVYGNELVLIGSEKPIEIDEKTIELRARQTKGNPFFSKTPLDPVQIFKSHFQTFKTFQRAANSDVNTDLYPKDEFSL